VAVLPALCGLLVLLSRMGSGRSRREGVLIAFTAVAIATLLITQVLSSFSALTLVWVAGSWVMLTLGVFVALRRSIAEGWARLREMHWPDLDRIDWLVAACLGAFGVATLASALLYPTTNFDSLFYHMPRVLMWYQNHSVARYPTPEARQLFSGPLVEYGILQLKVLSLGSDRLGNCIQWLSYIGAILATSLIAARLGASRRGQQFVAVATAAVPMAALQASTTQNDMTSALWSMIAVYCGVAIVRSEEEAGRSNLLLAAWAGAAIGLAVLAKPAAYLTCAPFIVWFGVAVFRRRGLASVARIAVIVLVSLVAINAAWYADNARLFGVDIIGANAPDNDHVLIKKHDPSSLVTAGLKNAALELGTPSAAVNDRIAGVVAGVVRLYGGDLNDPVTREIPAGPFMLDARVTLHDVAPSPMTMLLVVVSIAVILVSRTRDRVPGVIGYLVSAVVAFSGTACAITWNHYTNRVLLGSLLLLIPLAGVAFTLAEGRRVVRAVLVTVLAGCIAWSAFAVALNSTNRLISPSLLGLTAGNDIGYWDTSYEDLRFALVPPLREPSGRIAAAVEANGIERLGIHQIIAGIPMLPVMQSIPGVTFGFVGNTTLPDKIKDPDFAPQAILEVIPEDRYPEAMSEAARAGRQLMEPQVGLGWVFVLYVPE